MAGEEGEAGGRDPSSGVGGGLGHPRKAAGGRLYNHYGDPKCGATRDEQVLQVVADMATRKEEAVVIGDFNQTPDEFTITNLVIEGIV